MKYNYSHVYTPPAPSLEIQLGVLDETFTVGPLEALVDTGADATIIPIRYIKRLRIEPTAQRYLVSSMGGRVQVDIYSLDVGIAGMRLPAIDIVADAHNNEVVIGRSILNKLVITLNGPRQELEVVTRRR